MRSGLTPDRRAAIVGRPSVVPGPSDSERFPLGPRAGEGKPTISFGGGSSLVGRGPLASTRDLLACALLMRSITATSPSRVLRSLVGAYPANHFQPRDWARQGSAATPRTRRIGALAIARAVWLRAY